MSRSLSEVYDLRDDADTVQHIQKATLETKEFGLLPEPALFGFPEWWHAVDSGLIPVHAVDGVISRVYMTGHNDWPEFEIDDGKQRTSWTREGHPRAYQVGRRVRLEYVVQRFKTKRFTETDQTKVTVRVWIDLAGTRES